MTKTRDHTVGVHKRGSIPFTNGALLREILHFSLAPIKGKAISDSKYIFTPIKFARTVQEHVAAVKNSCVNLCTHLTNTRCTVQSGAKLPILSKLGTNCAYSRKCVLHITSLS